MPGAVAIAGKQYTLALLPQADIGGDYGECRPQQCEIRVSADQCEQQQRDVVLHEILHALDFEICGDKVPERVIRTLATGLLAVLRGNPALVAYLVAA